MMNPTRVFGHPPMHLLLVGLARGLQNRVIRVQVLSDAPICSYSLTERISVYGTEDGGSIPLASTSREYARITSGRIVVAAPEGDWARMCL